VFHLAGKTHGEGPQTPAAFRHDNVEKTVAFARAAKDGGARRFVFLSSIKVNGEETTRPFTSADVPAPQDEYGRSKLEAERALREILPDSVVVRSPLVYGAGAKGNLLALLHAADSPWPLPFAAVQNRRSFIHVDDLARLLVACAGHGDAPGRTFLAAHAHPVSTRDLVVTARRYLERPARVYALPRAVLDAIGAMAGQSDRMRRLTRSLEVDPSETQRVLGWTAQIEFAAAMEDMVEAYRDREA
jgi:UDP-glucose 4-epimerase